MTADENPVLFCYQEQCFSLTDGLIEHYSCMFLESVASSFSRRDNETDFDSLQVQASYFFVFVFVFGLELRTFFPTFFS